MEPTTPGPQGPPESPESHGVDGPEDRPGVPMAAEPSPDEGAHRERPERQGDGDRHLVRAALDRPTPVFGTAQRPHGASGALRRIAYDVPEHHARHWMLLLVADRVDVLEDRLGGALAAPLERMGLDDGAARVRSNPLPVLAGLALGAWLARKALS